MVNDLTRVQSRKYYLNSLARKGARRWKSRKIDDNDVTSVAVEKTKRCCCGMSGLKVQRCCSRKGKIDIMVALAKASGAHLGNTKVLVI